MGRFASGNRQQARRFYSRLRRAGLVRLGTATVAISLVKILALPEAMTIPLMILFGILFCVTALVGYKGWMRCRACRCR
jgi:cytosine permease